MKSVDAVMVGEAIEVLAKHASQPDRVESEVRALVGDDALARRLIDWIPEAFGAVLIGHMKLGINLPKTFTAKDAHGLWQEFPFSAEPIFVKAVQAAAVIHHEGPREVFVALAPSGCMVGAVNRALNAGADLSGASLAGPAMLGIPAETYSQP
jgi:hypothetical protein